MVKKLSQNQKKWKAYIESKLKAAKPIDRTPEFLAMMIAATIKLYNDVGLDLTTLNESVEEIKNDPGFKLMVRDPRDVMAYLQSPETVLKASRNVSHLFVDQVKDGAEAVGKALTSGKGEDLNFEEGTDLASTVKRIEPVREEKRPNIEAEKPPKKDDEKKPEKDDDKEKEKEKEDEKEKEKQEEEKKTDTGEAALIMHFNPYD